MKSLIALSLLLCIASAFEVRGPRDTQRERLGSMVQKVVVSSRITNGRTAAPNQFPYQAGLSVYDGKKRQFCGGSLISNEWVLTAAHCILTAVKVKIYLGSINRLDYIECLEVAKSNIIAHPDFDKRTIRNDIALIKIPALPSSDVIKPASLPPRASCNYVDETVIASGWGYTSDTSPSYSPVLQFASFKVITNAVCAEEYGSFIDSGKICTATVDRIGICFGDSGGPLVLASSNIQIGIISFFADGECESDAPAAYTRVTSYLDWIREKTGL